MSSSTHPPLKSEEGGDSGSEYSDNDDDYSDDESLVDFVRDGVYHSSECNVDGVTVQSNVQFDRHHLRNPIVNIKQREIITQIVDKLGSSVGIPLINANEVYNPVNILLGGKLNTDMVKMDRVETAGVYFVHYDNDDEIDGKVGRTTSTVKRMKDKKYSGKTVDLVFNYEFASDNAIVIIDKSTKTIADMEGVKLDGVNVEELNIDKCIELEEDGLSIIPRLVFDSHESKLDNIFGGCREVKGVTRAIQLNNSESAIDSVFRRRGINTCEVASQHEHLHCNAMQWVKAADIEVQAAANKCMDALINAGGEEWAGSAFEIWCWSSWAPDIPHWEIAATRLIYDAFFGKGSYKKYWDDVFAGHPKKDEQGSVYNARDGYEPTDRKAARIKQLGGLTKLVEAGGVMAFDVCNEAYRDVGTCLLEEASALGYNVIFEYLHLKVLYNESSVGVKSAILVHDPLCDIFQSSREKRIHWHQLVSQSKKAMTAHLMQSLFRKLRGAEGPVKTEQSFFGNFLTAFSMRVFALRNLHLHSYSATLLAKNVLSIDMNVFATDCHGLLASEHGVNKRQQRASIANKTRINNQKDLQLNGHMFNLLSLSTNDEELDNNIQEVANGFNDAKLIYTDEKRFSGKREYWGSLKDRLDGFIDTWLRDGTIGNQIRDKLYAYEAQSKERVRELQKPKVEKKRKEISDKIKRMSAKMEARKKKSEEK